MTKQEFVCLKKILEQLQIALDVCNKNTKADSSYMVIASSIKKILESIKQLLNQNDGIDIC